MVEGMNLKSEAEAMRSTCEGEKTKVISETGEQRLLKTITTRQ